MSSSSKIELSATVQQTEVTHCAVCLNPLAEGEQTAYHLAVGVFHEFHSMCSQASIAANIQAGAAPFCPLCRTVFENPTIVSSITPPVHVEAPVNQEIDGVSAFSTEDQQSDDVFAERERVTLEDLEAAGVQQRIDVAQLNAAVAFIPPIPEW